MASQVAEVEVLTAEVRVLMVGSRQVTLSVYRQLDSVSFIDEGFEPFGRVRDKQDKRQGSWVELVGSLDGVLVRSRFPTSRMCSEVEKFYLESAVKADHGATGYYWSATSAEVLPLDRAIWRRFGFNPSVPEVRGEIPAWLRDHADSWANEGRQRASEFEALPLIVLAGLR